MEKWRLNVLAHYSSTDAIGVCRAQLINLFNAIVFINDLECVASTDNLLTGVPGVSVPTISTGVCDIFYFQSTEKTSIPLADFEKVIDLLFSKSSPDISRVLTVSPQLKKYLKQYPFPKS